jgi:nitric oxide synthase oxygenase domain/subunit
MVDRADDNYQLDIDKANKVLGWQPQNRLYDVIPKMIADLKRDPLAWYKVNHLHAPGWLKDNADASVSTAA